LLDARLAQALQALQGRLEQAQQQALTPQQAQAPRASLGELTRDLAQHAPGHPDTGHDGALRSATSAHPELKSVRNFRNTWSKLSVDKQVAKALGQAPRNAGPINSHRLVLDSLALMREISPDYLNRFVCYADALLCLDEGGQVRPTPAKKSSRPKAVKK
jgi:hypothetical protein